MAYVDELLTRGEQVLYEARQHLVVLISRIVTELVLLALLIVAGSVASAAFTNREILGMSARELILFITVGISLFVLFSAFWDYFRWVTERSILTDRRVIQIRGVLNRSVVESSLGKINEIATHQSLFGRMFNFGTIEIMTASDEIGNIMENVVAPLDFKRAMLEAKHQYDRGYGYLEPVIPTNSPAYAAAPA